MTVVDASAVVDLLVPPDIVRRDWVIAALPEPSDPWLAPDILTFEVFAVLRRHVLRGALLAAAAWQRLQRLQRLPIEMMPTGLVLFDAWTLRDNLSAADSLYAALALRAGRPLLTSDLRLARGAGAVGIEVLVP
ncbi:MAG: type II toxin-antitoxin system VapC family toxin [Solirubrobacteraceae bacterium]